MRKEKIYNVPNFLSVSRIFFALAFVILLFNNFSKTFLILIFAIGALTDFFDGFIARRFKQTTKLGAKLDQIFDRIFTITIVVSLVIFYLEKNIFYVYLILICLSREFFGIFGLLIAKIREKNIFYVRFTGKATTFLQGVALGAIILEWQSLAIILASATFFAGILAGLGYLKYSLS